MKKIVFILTLAVLAGVCTFYACKKTQHSPDLSSKDMKGRLPQSCNFVDLSGTLSTQTLSNTNVYRLNGIVIIPNTVTLTIPAGTIIEGVKSATDPAWLVIEKGGKLIATGTSSNPIVFTSDQAPGSRNSGDWGGIAFAGNAPNNLSNSLSITIKSPSTSYTLTGGGATSNDNSGNLQYVNIFFGGFANSTDQRAQTSLLLNSVGTGTSIDHVQVGLSSNDGISAYGGTVKGTELISYNAGRIDFPISYGYIGKMQFLAAMRMDNTASPASAAYALDITNRVGTVSTATPITHPVISNVTVLGPNYCSGTTVNSNFQYAVHFAFNGGGEIYNSVFTSWNSGASSGLFIDGSNSIAQTAANTLEFSYNSFDNSGGTPYNSTTWTGGCETNMSDWITGLGGASCDETGNEFSVTTLGYNSSFCSNYCGNGFSQTFTLGTTTLSSPDYSWDSGSAFSHVSYRGSFGSTDFTQGWTNWCPLNTSYCI